MTWIMDNEELPSQVKEFINEKQKYGKDQQECLHDACPECEGTGTKKDGTPCVHMISCPCPKCTPSY